MKYLLIAILSMAPALSQAEDHLGGIAGINLASVRGESTDTRMQSFFMFGAYADFELSETAYLTPQLRYMQKGFGLNPVNVSGPVDANLSIQYLELPVYFKYKFPEGNNFRPNLFIGPAFGVKIGDTISAKNRNTGQTASMNGLVGGLLKSYDLAAEAGAGVEFMFGTDTIGSLNAAYSHGLINISKSGGNLKTQGIQIYGGIGF